VHECKPKLLQQLRSFVATEIQRKWKRLGDSRERETKREGKRATCAKILMLQVPKLQDLVPDLKYGPSDVA
jgi:hypothetical protein